VDFEVIERGSQAVGLAIVGRLIKFLYDTCRM